jgi:hypothetical protein
LNRFVLNLNINSKMESDKSGALKADVTEYKVEHVNGKQKVFFVINISYKGKKWSVNKRYSDFEEIMKQFRFHFT